MLTCTTVTTENEENNTGYSIITQYQTTIRELRQYWFTSLFHTKINHNSEDEI